MNTFTRRHFLQSTGAACTMAAKCIKRIIIPKFCLYIGNKEIADKRSCYADQERGRSIYESGCRRNTYQPGQDASHKAQCRHLFMKDLFNQHPDQSGRAGSNARVGQSLRHDIRCIESCTGVESKPAKP